VSYVLAGWDGNEIVESYNLRDEWLEPVTELLSGRPMHTYLVVFRITSLRPPQHAPAEVVPLSAEMVGHLLDVSTTANAPPPEGGGA